MATPSKAQGTLLPSKTGKHQATNGPLKHSLPTTLEIPIKEGYQGYATAVR
jgi:hypothetical protein